MLSACDIDASRHAGNADPSLLCIDGIVAVRRSKVRTPDRLIHVEQRLDVKAAVTVDEKLAVRAKIEQVDQTKEGERAVVSLEFLRTDGTTVAIARTTSLTADPNWLRDVPAHKGDPRAGFKLVSRKLLNAGKVQAYSEETGNRLHFDPAFAVRYGLRAPVANPLMTLTWAYEALSAEAAPMPVSLHAPFHSPLFWDDGVDILTLGRGGKIATVRCVSSSGALVSEIGVA